VAEVCCSSCLSLPFGSEQSVAADLIGAEQFLVYVLNCFPLCRRMWNRPLLCFLFTRRGLLPSFSSREPFTSAGPLDSAVVPEVPMVTIGCKRLPLPRVLLPTYYGHVAL
jgi:hypothetical protein